MPLRDSDAIPALARSETFTRFPILSLILLPGQARVVVSHSLSLRQLRRDTALVVLCAIGGAALTINWHCHSDRYCHRRPRSHEPASDVAIAAVDSLNHSLTELPQIINQSRITRTRRGTVSSPSGLRKSLTFRARNYMAFVITPRIPIADWLADLDAGLEHSRGFFAGRPVALDLSAVRLSPNGISQLVSSLEDRNIRILGIEGFEPTEATAKLPPLLCRGRGIDNHDLHESSPVSEPSPAATGQKKAASLLIENPVRTGQSVVFIEGDVTVLGSVASGAEIIAGGSIHVYGTLRGQVMAGADGNHRARIFCHRFDAELLAIGSCYRTADEIEESLRRGPVQVWLDGNTLQISAMN